MRLQLTQQSNQQIIKKDTKFFPQKERKKQSTHKPQINQSKKKKLTKLETSSRNPLCFPAFTQNTNHRIRPKTNKKSFNSKRSEERVPDASEREGSSCCKRRREKRTEVARRHRTRIPPRFPHAPRRICSTSTDLRRRRRR